MLVNFGLPKLLFLDKTLSPFSFLVQSYVCKRIFIIGIAKKPKKKYSKTNIDIKSSKSSKHQQSRSQNPNTIVYRRVLLPPQVNMAKKKITTIHMMTEAMYASSLRLMLKISSPLEISLMAVTHDRPMKIDTHITSTYSNQTSYVRFG